MLLVCLCNRYALGSVMMVGVAPEYLGVWLVWRGMSLALPPWVYQWGDDKLYSLYQRLVLFFFETCTRVEVGNRFLLSFPAHSYAFYLPVNVLINSKNYWVKLIEPCK